MSGQIDGFDSGEWYTVTTMEQVDHYLDGNPLIEDFKLDSLIVNDENTLQTTAPEFINPASLINVEPQRRGPPERNIVETNFNFTIEINSNDTNKKKYLYSHRLNRIYVDRECDFSVQFNWASALGAGMRVRACVVFADEAQAQKRPECCLQHLHQGASTVEKHIRMNVLHSSRPMGTQGVEYHGCAAAPDSWLSTVVALSKPGPEPVAHAYKFVCKNSCSSGINRRPIAIIFTLEDEQGAVYGRQVVGARVCSCPRRDMQKDEESEGVFKTGKKRVAANQTQPKQKKIKVETTETEERALTLPPLEIIGERVAITGLEVMLSMTQQALELRRGEPHAARYEDSIAKLKLAIQDLKDKPPTN